MANATGGSKPTGGAFDIDNANITYQTCTCNAGHACQDNRTTATAMYHITGTAWGCACNNQSRVIQTAGLGQNCPCNAANNTNTNQSIIYDASKLPHTTIISKVTVGSLITAEKWNEIRSAIIDSNKYRASEETSSGIINNISVGAIVTAANYTNLKTHLKDYNRYDIPTVSAGDTITAEQINKLIDAVQGQNLRCTCQCNYCTCQCNNCPCNTQYNMTCTCACNYCTCNCNYCNCNCGYSDKELKEDIKYL